MNKGLTLCPLWNKDVAWEESYTLSLKRVRRSKNLNWALRFDLYDTCSDDECQSITIEIVRASIIDMSMELTYSNTARSNPITWVFTQ